MFTGARIRMALALSASLVTTLSVARAEFVLQDYNLVVLNDLDTNSEVEGKVFVGGNLTSSGSNVGIGLSVPASDVSLVVGANLLGNGIHVEQGSAQIGGDIGSSMIVDMNSGGNVELGGTNDGTVHNGPVVPLGSPIDVATVAANIISTSANLESLAGNSTTTIQNGNQLVFNAAPSGPDNQAVFDVAASDIFGNNTLSQLILNDNGASQIIINVSGTDVTWNNGMNMTSSWQSDDIRSKVIWNFYEATSIELDRNLNGALLAPLAHLTNSTAIDGSVAVSSFTQRGEVHLPTVAVPEVSATLLTGLVACVGGIAIARRRSSRA